MGKHRLTISEVLVSWIPYQCNNRSTGFHSGQYNHVGDPAYVLLTLSPIGMMRQDVALHVSCVQNCSSKCRLGGAGKKHLVKCVTKILQKFGIWGKK